MEEKQLILGSKSARRRELLAMTGLKYDIMVSDEPEDAAPLGLALDGKGGDNASPIRLVGDIADDSGVVERVINIAARKAFTVRERCIDEELRGRVILGADTVVALDSELIGKPRDLDDAHRIIERLSGRRHRVVTVYVICETDSERVLIRPTVSWVYFRPIEEWEIDEYISTGEVLDKAGAYGIQEKAALFVERIEGDFYNIVGLPVVHLRSDLAEFGIKLGHDGDASRGKTWRA